MPGDDERQERRREQQRAWYHRNRQQVLDGLRAKRQRRGYWIVERSRDRAAVCVVASSEAQALRLVVGSASAWRESTCA